MKTTNTCRCANGPASPMPWTRIFSCPFTPTLPAKTLGESRPYYLDAVSDAGAARVAARENALSESTEPGDVLTDLCDRHESSLQTTGAWGPVPGHFKGQEVFGEEQTQDLGVKTALFAVLVWSRMPSILFESSFLSNPEDELRLCMPLYQQQTLADAMAEGIAMWFEEQDR